MIIDIFQVDAFTDKVFGGNPAAVCPLTEWLSDDVLQNIAAENNLSETAFFIKTNDRYHLRWFTPTTEVELCGHATMAAAFVIFTELDHTLKTIHFDTLSGTLTVQQTPNGLQMDFPLWHITPMDDIPHAFIDALGTRPTALFTGKDWLSVFETRQEIENLDPNMEKLAQFPARGILATAPGDSISTDFVSRCFYPAVGVPEDPVTGSAHCTLAPYWADRLKKTTLSAQQISQRGGALMCEIEKDRLKITGNACLYMRGQVFI